MAFGENPDGLEAIFNSIAGFQDNDFNLRCDDRVPRFGANSTKNDFMIADLIMLGVGIHTPKTICFLFKSNKSRIPQDNRIAQSPRTPDHTSVLNGRGKTGGTEIGCRIADDAYDDGSEDVAGHRAGECDCRWTEEET